MGVFTDLITDSSGEITTTEEIDGVITEVKQKAAPLIDYVNVAADAIQQESGKGDPFVGILFLMGREGLPYVENLIKEAIEGAELRPLPDWVYNVPGGVGGVIIDVFILFGPTKRLPKKVQAIVYLATAVSWGASFSGPVIEGWVTAKFGEGAIATKAVEILTNILKSVNPRLVMLQTWKTIQAITESGPFPAGTKPKTFTYIPLISKAEGVPKNPLISN